MTTLTHLGKKFQEFVEPLCHKNETFKLTPKEQREVESDLTASNPLAVHAASLPLRANDLLAIIEASDLVHSEAISKILAPRLTMLNRVGLSMWQAFTVGTECKCCWGLRVVASISISFFVGFTTRGYL
jgi:hypothetical protein